MKKKLFFGLFLLIGFFSSCGTLDVATEHSSRTQFIRGGDLIGEDKIAKIDVDFSRRIHATSNWQPTKNAAREEAEHMAIRENQIDVVVDPIWKYTISPIFSKADGAPWHFAYKAELLGYAGMYKKAISNEEMIQQLKEVDMETIEKYKLLTDPNYQPYAQPEDNSVQGSVILNGTERHFAPMSFTQTSLPISTAPSTPTSAKEEESKSLIVKPTSQDLKTFYPSTYFNYVGKQKMNTGKVFVGMGTPTLLAGLACIVYTELGEYNWEVELAGLIMAPIGAVFEVIGIPCWCVGKKDIKRANGEALTFNYQVAPIGVGLALNF